MENRQKEAAHEWREAERREAGTEQRERRRKKERKKEGWRDSVSGCGGSDLTGI